MSDDPKEKWGPGQMDDGSIDIMTIEQARKAAIQRDADEQAFGQIDEDDDGTVPVDLDDLSVEELDQIINGLDDDEDE